MGATDLIERVTVTTELTCDIRRHSSGPKAHLYPVHPRVYWATHLDMDLTPVELKRILEAVQRAQETS